MHDINFDAIAAVFDRLAPTWGNNDIAGFRAEFLLPCTAFLPHGVLPLIDDDAFFRSFVDPTLARLRELNFAKSTYDRLSVTTLSATQALASMRWTRHRTDGTVLEVLGATYTLMKQHSTWKIVAVIAHDAERVLEFD